MNLRAFAQDKLNDADIRVDGERPWDIFVHDDRLWARLLMDSSLGAGEAYMDGWWDCAALDQMAYKLIRSHIDGASLLTVPARIADALIELRRRFVRFDPFQVAKRHYDIGNDIYEAMLDRRMVYSCGYWNGAADLDTAQEQKLDLVCRKMALTPGMRILDIGGGWGSFAQFAAENYGVCVVNISVSREQVALANERCARYKDCVENRLMPYQKLPDGEVFDRIVSIGMFEHVTAPYYRRFFEIARRHLKDNGLFLLHSIGKSVTATSDPWMERYIFPNSAAPSLQQIGREIEGLFVVEDFHNIGHNYDPTLMAWYQRFEAAWPSLKRKSPSKYTDRFFRMWRYYLLTCAGAFRSRAPQVWQFVLSKTGVIGGYSPVR